MKARPVPERKSWRDEIAEPFAPIVYKEEAQPIPHYAKVRGGQVRIKGLYVGRTNSNMNGTYHRAHL